MKATDEFKKTIRNYLVSRGSKDPLFARIVTKPNKNMDDCITYILNTVQKSGCNGFTDDEVYSMAIHYFDEDNVNVGSPISNYKVVVNHNVELTEEEKQQAKEKAMEELKNEIKTKARKKPVVMIPNTELTAEQRANEHSGSKSAEQTLF